MESSEFFVLVLSQCVLARWFCQAEIRRALELRKPIVIVRYPQGANRAGPCR